MPPPASPPPPSHPPLSARTLLLTVSLLVAILLVLGFAGITLWHSRENHQDKARTDVGNLVQVLDHHLDGVLHEVDLALLTAADEFKLQQSRGSLHPDLMTPFLHKHQERLPQLDSLRIADAQGMVRYGPGVNEAKPVNLSDREFFQRSRAPSGLQPAITLPVFARISQEWVLPMARRLETPDGTFAGIVYANISMQYIKNSFHALNVGKHGVVHLLDDQRRIFVRTPEPGAPGSTIGRHLLQPPLIAAMQAQERSALYEASGTVDGIPRLYAYRKVGNTNLHVQIGLALQDILAPWWKEVWVVSSYAVTFSILLLASSLLLGQTWRRLERSLATLGKREAELRHSNARAEEEISERTRLHQQLMEALDLNRKVFDCVNVGILAYRADSGQCVFANAASGPIIGATHAQVLAQNFRQIPSWQRSPLLAMAERALSTRQDQRGEVEVSPTSFGKSLILGVFFSTFTQQEVQHLLFVMDDITERKRAENVLREEEQRLREITATLAEGLFVTDRELRVTFINPTALAMLGWTEEEVLGQDSHALFHHTHDNGTFYPTRACPLTTIMETGDTLNTEDEVFWKKDGSSIPVSLTVSVLKRDGRAIGTVAAFRDMTERKKSEQELLQAKHQAEQAARVKSEFLSAMSHEIRTPMNVVLGLSGVLLETELSPVQRQYVEMMHNSGGALLGIINDILDISRIEAGQFMLLHLPFSPIQVVVETTRLMQLSAEQKGLALTTEIGEGIPAAIQGDTGRVRQILVNLIGNAIKFTEQGEIRVRVAPHPHPPDGLLFSVRDTGIGIEPHNLERIFEQFTQADAGITRRFGGTGLGLAISRKLVELMGGEIRVESQPGQGSTFAFTLPAHGVEPASAPNHPAMHPPEEPGRSLRILLAEDSEDNRQLFRIYLRKTPHHVVMVHNGAEAVERVRQETFDVVLMDIQMPVMDGYTATSLIRRWEQETGRPPLTILALSAHASHGKQEESLRAGCNGHLTKPINKPDLLAAIQGVKLPSGGVS